MATQEEITSAYALVFESEKAKAQQYIDIVNKFNADIESLAKGLPDTASNSALAGAVQQARSMTAMYPGTSGSLRAVYQLSEETDTSADSTV